MRAGQSQRGLALGHLDVSLGRDEQVVGLQIAMDDAVGVQILERQHDLGSVLPRCVLLERTEGLRRSCVRQEEPKQNEQRAAP